MFPLFFPPVATTTTTTTTTPMATTTHPPLAPACFATEVDLRESEGYNYVRKKYGLGVFRRPGPCQVCNGDPSIAPWSGDESCKCVEGEQMLDPADVDVIAFQVQLYELGLDADWIRRQVQYRGMESRERLRYELDGTERFFCDGVPSSRILPTGVQIAALKPSPQKVQAPAAAALPSPPPPPQYANQQRTTPGGRRESRLRYMETVDNARTGPNKGDVLVMLGKMRLGDAEKGNNNNNNNNADLEPVSARRNNGRRRRGRVQQQKT